MEKKNIKKIKKIKKTKSQSSIYKGVTQREVLYSESYDEYLECIYRLSLNNPMGWVKNKEISERLDVKPPSVSNMLEKLSKAKLVEWKPRAGLRLSKKGKERAKELVMNHITMGLFFERILKMSDPIEICKIACKFEHHITPEIKNQLMDLMGIEENFSNVNNFIMEDKLPTHFKTRSIYSEQHIEDLLIKIKLELLEKLKTDSKNQAKISETFEKYQKKYQK